MVEYRELKYNEIIKIKVDFIQYWLFEKKYKKRSYEIMIKVLFVCHGNFCRSAMAENMFRALLVARGIDWVSVDSAATSREEIGNPIYPPARAKLEQEGVPVCNHRARQLTKADYDAFDWLIGMDAANMRNMAKICGGDPAGKMHLFLALAGEDREIADPWYTRNFDQTFNDVAKACEALLEAIMANRG